MVNDGGPFFGLLVRSCPFCGYPIRNPRDTTCPAHRDLVNLDDADLQTEDAERDTRPTR